jgi:hypothetical protein
VDVGQRASKVYAFCLVEARAGAVSVSFERGAWRPLLEGAAWPKGDAGVFEDLGRESRLSETAERCALAILDRSELVVRWRALSRDAALATAASLETRRPRIRRIRGRDVTFR